MSGSNDVATEIKVGGKFYARRIMPESEVEALCDAILEKLYKLKEDLEPVPRKDDGATPDTRDGSSLIMHLRAIMGLYLILRKMEDCYVWK